MTGIQLGFKPPPSAYKVIVRNMFSMGQSIALGIAWNLDNGFWHILLDYFLGWIYVAFKIAQYLWPV